MERLKRLLDEKAEQYNCKEFIKDDPVQFPHQFSDKRDIEIAALLASVIAWGNRRMIINSGNKMLFGIMEGKPYDYIMSGKFRSLCGSDNIHRTFFVRDFVYLCNGLQNIYSKYGSMEPLFTQCDDVWGGLSLLRGELSAANESTYTKHISNPVAAKGKPASACKRLHMMLRWLCRQDGIVDLGIWHDVAPSKLMIPLDVHVARTGRALGLINRTQNDRKTVEELTAQLRAFCPSDPVRYDFALFGVGVAGDEFFKQL
ncbi:MAG: TIGR02757 family protein [Bacteroidaceae bacterium]|nr:TIGR02757 family protein [Bacteroidaceae bacterium]